MMTCSITRFLKLNEQCLLALLLTVCFLYYLEDKNVLKKRKQHQNLPKKSKKQHPQELRLDYRPPGTEKFSSSSSNVTLGIKKMSISPYPMVQIIATDTTDMGNPEVKKSRTTKYFLAWSSVTSNDVTFGNDENGSAQPEDTANAAPMPNRTGFLQVTPTFVNRRAEI